MSTYFTADTHFFHKNIIKYCNRPYSDVTEMNKDLIERWNSMIPEKDSIVYHLGDFSIESKNEHDKRRNDVKEFFGQLNGERKILIAGNHDKKFLNDYRFLFHEVYDSKIIVIDGMQLFLNHYPQDTWEGYHLHGHSHGESESLKNRLDVGVDCNNYFPFSINDVKIKISQ